MRDMRDRSRRFSGLRRRDVGLPIPVPFPIGRFRCLGNGQRAGDAQPSRRQPMIRPIERVYEGPRIIPPSALLRQQKARHDDEMTANATDERFVIDNFSANRGEPHFRHPALDLPAGVLLLPVETLAGLTAPVTSRLSAT